LCRKLSCSGHTCNSQDSLNSAYSEDDEEPGYYHIMPRKSNLDCSSLAIESHSCQTYEDHATQTEDEDEEDDLKDDDDDPSFPPYGKKTTLF
jgi:hypothetical protein